MIISTRQMEVFRDNRLRQFEQRVLDHLHKCFPRQCANALPLAIRSLANWSFERGRAYGFESEWELVRYLDLVMTFGRDFEESGKFAAVAQHLDNHDLNARTRITRAFTAAHDIPAEAEVGATT